MEVIIPLLIFLGLYLYNTFKLEIVNGTTDEEMRILISEHPVFKKIFADFSRLESEKVWSIYREIDEGSTSASRSMIRTEKLFGEDVWIVNMNKLSETKSKLLNTLKELRKDEEAKNEIERILTEGKKKNELKRVGKELRILKRRENELKYGDFLLENFPNSEVYMADSQIMELLMSEFNVGTDKAKIMLDDLTDADTGLLSSDYLGLPIYKYY